MNYLKNSLINVGEFLVATQAYFRDVLVMHGVILFIIIPLLSNSTQFILKRGHIHYLSYDNLGDILVNHPAVALSLVLILLIILLVVFFEFTFLLLSVYFIKKKQPVSLRQLLRMTLLQIKKLRPSVFLFFLFYFFLILPLGGLSFNSDLLSKIKIPAFIQEFIFSNRVWVVSSFVLFYLALLYVGIRVIFALPEMILSDLPFREAIRESLRSTKRRFFAIVGQFIAIGVSILAVVAVGFGIVLLLQLLIENYFPDLSLSSAVFAMTFLQFFLLLNIIFSTVGIFYIIIDFMDDENFLPEIPEWFYQEPLGKKRHKKTWDTLLIVLAIFFGIGVALYNMNYLTSSSPTIPLTFSHRGVSDRNGVQNSLTALEKTSKFKPDYVEMDVQLTKDKQFIVVHDFNLRNLTGVNKKPGDLTLAQLEKLTVKENGQHAPLVSFDAYLEKAQELDQKLLIEIKTQEKDVTPTVDTFLEKYATVIHENQYMVQSLSYPVVEEIKTKEPTIQTGYILPFNLVGSPITKADFLTMEYSTINRNFINAAKADGKKVIVWTPNSEEGMSRMIFYGVDGIITDQMPALNQAVKNAKKPMTYSDKLINFVIGVG
ncbi:glycerophosphoryl diester phosphodiesterase membrane domain-containing protein [Enterococcus massiliensis]|uniref:glycerophosphoryl diester phosphodiesterase membrane domain-containing protein n=1 Tax=Enterococcus massiliensis TaxID=1640685 RepID=UPI00065E9928|nr:glycerophosphodiester phosphodiesterase [Enterococcus massiliensis]